MSLEADLEGRVVEYAKNRGVPLILKLNVLGQIGWPDRLFLRKSKVLFIEFKREGEKLRKIQDYRANKLRDHGFRVEMVDNYEQGCRVIDSFTPDHQDFR